MNLGVSRVLAISPHPDDIEFGAGGTVARLLEGHATVQSAVFSDCADSIPDRAVRQTEVERAAWELGLTRLCCPLYPVRRFDAHRQEILEVLVELQREYEPEIVLCPSTHDDHQDHAVLCQEAIRAFRGTTVLGYESAGGNRSFDASLLVTLEEQHVEKKLAAVACYASQQHRPYFDPAYLKAWARTRGVHARATYAEAFEVIRAVV